MTKNEIVGRLKDGGLDASSTNRNAAVYVTDARNGRAEAGWFVYRIICNSDETERRARAILSRWYDIEASGDVWRLKSKNRIPLMAIKRGAAPSANGYMYLEAVEANSTIKIASGMMPAPNFEYSTDGEIWQTLNHTTEYDVHLFDTITLGAVGDKVYLRGDNPDGLNKNVNEDWAYTRIEMTGKISAGGNVMSMIDSTMETTVVPENSFISLFTDDEYDPNTSLVSADIFGSITAFEAGCCAGMFTSCTSLTAAADMPKLETIGEHACGGMYSECTFNMSDDGTTLNFAFPTPPVTAGETTYATAYDIADWMGNTNGFYGQHQRILTLKTEDMITIKKATKKEAKANAAKMKKHAAEMKRKQAKNEAK